MTETYTASGLPRIASARARSHRARIGDAYFGGHVVTLPDGTRTAFDSDGNRRPDTPTPSGLPGDTLAEFLNAYADSREG